ncbi:sesquipedalian-1-like isoform X2 [Osmerus mordax]|uniref:sesquipedalian-1-like isoform X2 n=1 Tax=Osmerus mordax TaxID=8014 RepID=UPI003510461D
MYHFLFPCGVSHPLRSRQLARGYNDEMKIHGKILTHFQTCDSPVDKEGYLYKKGERNTSYQKRWFVLKGNLLFYQDRPGDRNLLGVIILEGCAVQLCESEEQFAFSLVWSGPGLRTYKLAADNQDAQEAWIKALLTANHGYLSLLVMDLEKQYREAMKAFPNDLKVRSSTLPGPTSVRPAQSVFWPSATPPPTRHPGPVGSKTNQMLLTPATTSKPANRRSPKLWPKRNANVVPISGPAPPQGEWAVIESGLKDDFSKLHEDFGKEVRELIADWLRRRQDEEVVHEENLIDFG